MCALDAMSPFRTVCPSNQPPSHGGALVDSRNLTWRIVTSQAFDTRVYAKAFQQEIQIEVMLCASQTFAVPVLAAWNVRRPRWLANTKGVGRTHRAD
jgi:hypothetical protein